MSMYFADMLGLLMRDSDNPVTSARGQAYLNASQSTRDAITTKIGGAAKSVVKNVMSEGLVSGLATSAVQARDSISRALPSSDASQSVSYSQPVPTGGGVNAQLPDYLNADLAKAYGMDATTAYQEALSNTSYQRAVKDLQAAGLNPVLAAGQVAPAGGVYSAQLNGSGVNVSSGVSSAHGAYKFMSAAGGLVGTIIGALNGGTKGAYFGNRVGSSAGAAIGNIIDMI